MAIKNKTFLELINEVSTAINGKNASVNSRPTKAEIATAINDTQLNICNKDQQFLFLRKTGTVNGYTLETFTTTYEKLDTNLSTAQVSLATTGTAYIASKVTSATVFKITNTVIKVAKVTTGFGEFYGNMQVDICGGVTEPNIADVKMTSNLFNPYRPNTTGMYEPFTFSGGEVLPAGTYWVVLKIMPNVYNGVPLKFGTVTGSTGGMIKDFNGNWVACEDMGYDLVTYAGDYTTTVTLPDDVRYVHRLYSVANSINLEAYPYDVYMRKGGDINTTLIPNNIFILNGLNGDDITAILKTDKNLITWSIDYMAIPNELVNDSDISIIPKPYRNILKWGAMLLLISQNAGINLNSEIIDREYQELLMKLKEDYLPYEQQNLSVDCGGYVPNMVDIEFDEPNTWVENRTGG